MTSTPGRKKRASTIREQRIDFQSALKEAERLWQANVSKWPAKLRELGQFNGQLLNLLGQQMSLLVELAETASATPQDHQETSAPEQPSNVAEHPGSSMATSKDPGLKKRLIKPDLLQFAEEAIAAQEIATRYQAVVRQMQSDATGRLSWQEQRELAQQSADELERIVDHCARHIGNPSFEQLGEAVFDAMVEMRSLATVPCLPTTMQKNISRGDEPSVCKNAKEENPQEDWWAQVRSSRRPPAARRPRTCRSTRD